VTDNPLLVGATTINSAGLANLAAVASNHAILVLDPLRAAGAPEMVIVTAHIAAATSATITRGAYGTTARQHASGTLWVHAPTKEDVIQILTSSTRPADPYQGQLIYETDTDTFTARGAGAVWQTVATLGAWTAYTPTLTQSATVTKTVTNAKYARVGRLIVVQASLACTGSGTGGNRVLFGLPIATTTTGFAVIGTGTIFDISAGIFYAGSAIVETTTTAKIVLGNGTVTEYLGVAGFSAALASGDLIGVSLAYEAAS
jgi:hypothetical protein